MSVSDNRSLDQIHHVAIEVDDVSGVLAWYESNFECRVEYFDSTWALVKFANVSLALVTRGAHPPHIGLVTAHALSHNELVTHRDGTRSVYVSDPAGNAVELLDPSSVTTSRSFETA